MQGTNIAAGLILLAFLTPAVCPGQTPPKIEFEAASIRTSSPLLPAPQQQPGEEKPLDGVRSGGPGTQNPGVVTYSRVPLDHIIADAFDLSWDRIAGPGWISVERYDIVGRIRSGSTPDEVFLMLQNLLMERLRLTFHVQTKILPGFHLLSAPAGPRLKESQLAVVAPWRASLPAILIDKEAGGFPQLPAEVRQGVALTPGHVRATFRDTAMSEFAQYLGTRLSAPSAPGPASAAKRIAPAAVLDKTGLDGRYDFTFDEKAAPQGSPTTWTGMNTALAAQLGLKLMPAKVAVDVLVIDHVDKTPAAN